MASGCSLWRGHFHTLYSLLNYVHTVCDVAFSKVDSTIGRLWRNRSKFVITMFVCPYNSAIGCVGKQHRISNGVCVRLELLVDAVDTFSTKGKWKSTFYFQRNEAVNCCSHELHTRGGKCIYTTSACFQPTSLTLH
jgi:hypothetical protein